MDFLNDLNEAQREAVISVEGPHMVIAGAGSGKTRVLTYRLAFILSQGLAYPQELLALTFTNKAAKEMKARIAKLAGPEAKSIVMGTFHSIFSRILRIEADKIGFTSSYTIYDSDDQVSLIKAILKARNWDPKVYKPKVISNLISGAKNRLISPSQFKDEFVYSDLDEKTAAIYHEYETRLLKSNAMDFDDLLIKPILLFENHPEIKYKYQHRFKYIMVDEYQDTNHAQYTLTNMLAAAHQNICVVGDDAQSIYGFRGANIQNILNLKKDYPDLKVMKLEQNYRSTKVIVNAANAVISRNRDQIEKKVFTENKEGEKIWLVTAVSEQDEAKRISNSIREQRQMFSYFYKDFAILYRTNAQSRAIEDELRRAGLTYKIFGGISFYQRKEIKDTVAYLKLAVNPRDDEALRRVLNYPTRGIGKTSQDRISVYADQQGLTLWECLGQISKVGLNKAASNRIQDFYYMIQDFGVKAKNNDAYTAAAYIAKNSGILKLLHSDNNVEGLTRWENVQELLNSAQAFVDDPDNDSDTLENFLADISLFTDQDQKIENDDYISLMTVHSAKGLEFKSVFLVGMEENLFPSAMAMETRADLEEERRLFYVAVTRAEERLIMTHAKSRYRFGDIQYNEPSRFISEVGEEYLKRPTQFARRAVEGGSQPAWSKRRGAVESPSSPRMSSRAAVQKDENSNFVAAHPSEIKEGLNVRHQRFGNGKVVTVEGEGGDRKATVLFKAKGKKVLLLKFAKLQIVS
ncbi:MAG: UvrD-helicase domain-containing protein [Bacteroidia bacterium]|nr:UvrD-helicase domain-containing protein [Bacteroidia bacterium]